MPLVAITVVVFIAIIAAFMMLPARTRSSTLNPNLIAVFPFRVASASPSLAPWGEGMVDYLYTRLTGDVGPATVNPRAAISAWRRIGGHDADPENLTSAARRFGAELWLDGSLVGSPESLTVQASLVSVSTGEVIETATASGTESDLNGKLVDQLALQLLAIPIGGASRQGLTTSLPALKAYLEGERAYRSGLLVPAIDNYESALAIDSGFALAALGLFQAAQGAGEVEAGDAFYGSGRALRALRSRLSSRDEAYATTLSGPDLTEPGYVALDNIRVWETAVIAEPTRPEAWYRLGERWLQLGPALAVPDWIERAATALDTALALDAGFVPAIAERLEVAILSYDTTAMRQLSSALTATDSTSRLVRFYHWHVAAALRDTAALARTLSRPGPVPYYVASQAMHHTMREGYPVEFVEPLVQEYLRRPAETAGDAWARDNGTLVHRFLAMAQGRARDVIRLSDSLNPGLYWFYNLTRLAVTDPGYSDAIVYMASVLATQADTASSDASGVYRALCADWLWRTSQGDTVGVGQAIADLYSALPELPWGDGNAVWFCPRLLEAMVDPRAPPVDSTSAPFAFVDSVVRRGRVYTRTWSYDGTAVAVQWLARACEALGDYDEALAVIRRRPRFSYIWSAHWPGFLKEEGRLAALAGDTAGAIDAYQRYLNLRTKPDSGSMQEQVDEVKRALAELVGERSLRN